MKRYTKPSAEFSKRFQNASKYFAQQQRHIIASANFSRDKQIQNASEQYRDDELNSATKTKSTLTSYLKTAAVTCKPKQIKPHSWHRDEAIEALQLENDFSKVLADSDANLAKTTLVVRFPDPPIDKQIVQQFNKHITHVHFQQSCAPRYCFVQLHSNADVQEAINALNQTPFGNGFLKAALSQYAGKSNKSTKPEEIDTRTLYVGNLPKNLTANEIKAYFPSAQRVDIKNARYAFVRYRTFAEAKEAFKQSVCMVIESCSLVVRFRRFAVQNSKESQTKTTNAMNRVQVDDAVGGKIIAADTILYANSTLLENNVSSAANEMGSANNAVTDTCARQEAIALVKQERDFFDLFETNPSACEANRIEDDDTFSIDVNCFQNVEDEDDVDSKEDIKPIIQNVLTDTKFYLNDLRHELKLEKNNGTKNELDDIFAELET